MQEDRDFLHEPPVYSPLDKKIRDRHERWKKIRRREAVQAVVDPFRSRVRKVKRALDNFNFQFEHMNENAPVIGRHNPMPARPRLKHPTGGDRLPAPLPPGDRPPNNKPKHLGRIIRKPNNLSNPPNKPLGEEVRQRSRRDIIIQRYGTTKLDKSEIKTLRTFGIKARWDKPNTAAVTRALTNKKLRHPAAANTLARRQERVGATDAKMINSLSGGYARSYGRDDAAYFNPSVDALLNEPVHVGVGVDRTLSRSNYKTLAGNYRRYRKVELEKVRQGSPVIPRLIREAVLADLVEAPSINLMSKEPKSLLTPSPTKQRETNFNRMAQAANIPSPFANSSPSEKQRLPVRAVDYLISKTQKSLNQNVTKLSHHIPAHSTFAGNGLEAAVFSHKPGQNPENWSVIRVSTPKRPTGIKPRVQSSVVTPSVESKRVGRFQLDVAPYRLAGANRSAARGLAATSVMYRAHKEGLLPTDAHDANIGVHPRTGKTELIDPGFITRLDDGAKKRLHDYYTKTDPTSVSSAKFREGALSAVYQPDKSIGKLARAKQMIGFFKNSPAPIRNSLDIKPTVGIKTVRNVVNNIPLTNLKKMIRLQKEKMSRSSWRNFDTTPAAEQARRFMLLGVGSPSSSSLKQESIREVVIRTLRESALANAAGGGSKLNVGAADNTTNGVNLASKTPVIGNSTVKTYAAGKASGGGKLGGGFGTQGQGASRFSGGGASRPMGSPTATNRTTGGNSGSVTGTTPQGSRMAGAATTSAGGGPSAQRFKFNPQTDKPAFGRNASMMRNQSTSRPTGGGTSYSGSQRSFGAGVGVRGGGMSGGMRFGGSSYGGSSGGSGYSGRSSSMSFGVGGNRSFSGGRGNIGFNFGGSSSRHSGSSW